MFLDAPGAMAGVTGMAYRGARTAAIGTGLLDREKPLLHADLTMTAAGTAGFRGTTLLRTGARAAGTVLHSRHPDLHRGTGYRIFETQFKVVLQVGALTYSRSTATDTKYVTKNITESIAETTATKTTADRLIDTGVTKLIIRGAFVWIGKDLVSFFGFLEMLFSFGIVWITVRMVLHRETSKRFFQIGIRG
jgi:hypothetical protein